MQTISKDELLVQKDLFSEKIREGVLFIHPTDTIYGIGCDATNHDAVYKVREAKKRYSRPFSIIAPSKDWIRQNCEIDKAAEKWLRKLPGPYTLVLKLSNKEAIATNVNMDMETVGVRIPDHWFTAFVAELNIPVITTSANVTKENFMTSEENLDSQLSSHLDFMVYEGEKHGSPSKIIDLTQDELIIER